MTSTNDLNLLAAQAGRGDAQAATQLRRRLEPELVRIVGRTLRVGVARTPLAREILARARQVPPATDCRPGESRERLIHTVAHAVCESVIGGLRYGPQHNTF